ncbi:MAG: outer membrane protein assembly factor BamE [Gammaproteobacteria bacterium]|nr:outer membrane protein assembly factor BamE [Gammaproteobacteria bacterium]
MMKTSNKIILTFAALLPMLSLTGCYPFLYHPPLQQGNAINQNAVSQLRIGMTKDQVATLMGSPVLNTPETPNEWHYVYSKRLKGKLVDQKQLILQFAGNKLSRISAD